MSYENRKLDGGQWITDDLPDRSGGKDRQLSLEVPLGFGYGQQVYQYRNSLTGLPVHVPEQISRHLPRQRQIVLRSIDEASIATSYVAIQKL